MSAGELHIEDTSRPGETVILTVGDVILLERGAIVKATTPSTAKGMSKEG